MGGDFKFHDNTPWHQREGGTLVTGLALCLFIALCFVMIAVLA